MGYRVFWQVPHQFLYLELEGYLSLDDFMQINLTVNDLLSAEVKDRQVTLVIDITRPCTAPKAFAQLKASQTYLMRRDLKYILVVGSNKLMRLMMMLTFNLSKPSLWFFDSFEQALKFAQW